MLCGSDLITFLLSHTSSFFIQSLLLLSFTQSLLLPLITEKTNSPPLFHVPFSLTLPLSNVLPSSNKKSITIPSPPRHVDFLDRKKGKEKQSAQGGNFDERERERTTSNPFGPSLPC